MEHLVREDILEAIDTTETPIEWASPIDCMPKCDVQFTFVWICTINQHMNVDPHPLPR